jgi:hypothetical protein
MRSTGVKNPMIRRSPQRVAEDGKKTGLASMHSLAGISEPRASLAGRRWLVCVCARPFPARPPFLSLFLKADLYCYTDREKS